MVEVKGICKDDLVYTVNPIELNSTVWVPTTTLHFNRNTSKPSNLSILTCNYSHLKPIKSTSKLLTKYIYICLYEWDEMNCVFVVYLYTIAVLNIVSSHKNTTIQLRYNKHGFTRIMGSPLSMKSYSILIFGCPWKLYDKRRERECEGGPKRVWWRRKVMAPLPI